MNKQAFWKSDWFIGAVLALLFCFAYNANFKPLKSLELKAYDIAVSSHLLPTNKDIVIIDIDDASMERMGRWPWPRSEFANVIKYLSNANAQVIGLAIPFRKQQRENSTSQASKQFIALLRQQGKNTEATKIESELQALNGDFMLESAIKESGNVYMSMQFSTDPLTIATKDLPTSLKPMVIKNSFMTNASFEPIQAQKLRYPFQKLASVAAGIGILTPSIDHDGVLRSSPLLIQYHQQQLPSLALLMAARIRHISVADIHANLGSSIEFGLSDIQLDSRMRMYPVFHGKNNTPNYKHYSFYDVISQRIPSSSFQNKIVLIGISEQSLSANYNTPINNHMSNIEFQAHVLQSILDTSFYSQPTWGHWVSYALLILIGIYLATVLPRCNIKISLLISSLLLATFIASNFLLLNMSMIWVESICAALLLILGHIILPIKHYILARQGHGKNSAEASETNKMLGLSFQSQGMLDMAFDKFRKCPINDDILQCIYNLALDFERKRQFNKASSIYEYIQANNASYKDVPVRVERMKTAGETMIFGASTAGGISSLLITGGAKPTLGRYEIVREIGKGAMGTVYLGRDPKINREVAIKTMALAQEFEADEMEEVKERFFREAETAGMLNHPNIVTIFDAGDEHDLAYIAMEYLDGCDLAPYTKKGKLFSTSATMKICGKVAEALHYAQSQNVVHRDIKPANIMLLKDKSIKVTDFGIARITASSKTKTGVVLGTPSYMSPEQLSGKHVDGRSDLFSLGVMMYEMLTGSRPFRGDSMATLMFQIANEPHPDIREHNSNLSEHTAKLIDHMLAKDPEMRITNGAAVVKEIIKCLQEMASKGVK